jgi:peroxiredoxin
MPLSAGVKAPDFTLLDENESAHNLSDYRGKPLVLYFYPKDDTPGCTKEACNFRDDYSAYEEAAVTIIGVSPDTPKKHAKLIYLSLYLRIPITRFVNCIKSGVRKNSGDVSMTECFVRPI